AVAELVDLLGVRHDLGVRRRRAVRVKPGLLEQRLVVPKDRQVGQVGQPEVLAVRGGKLQVTRAQRALEGQRVDVLGDVHQCALAGETRNVDVVESDDIGYRSSSDRGCKLAGVIIRRR